MIFEQKCTCARSLRVPKGNVEFNKKELQEELCQIAERRSKRRRKRSATNTRWGGQRLGFLQSLNRRTWTVRVRRRRKTHKHKHTRSRVDPLGNRYTATDNRQSGGEERRRWHQAFDSTRLDSISRNSVIVILRRGRSRRCTLPVDCS